MFVKGEHERQFAYEAHTACDKRGFILGVEVTAGNIHDSVAWDKVYDDVTSKFDVQFVAMEKSRFSPIQDIKAAKKDTAPGTTNTIQ